MDRWPNNPCSCLGSERISAIPDGIGTPTRSPSGGTIGGGSNLSLLIGTLQTRGRCPAGADIVSSIPLAADQHSRQETQIIWNHSHLPSLVSSVTSYVSGL